MVDGVKEARARSRVMEPLMMSPGGMVWVMSTRRAAGEWLNRTAFMAATYQSSRPKSVVRLTIGIGRFAIEEFSTNGKIEVWLRWVKRCRACSDAHRKRKRLIAG